jgi:hypothetical protein
MVRNVTKTERCWDLKPKTNGSHGVAGESRIPKAGHDCRGVGVEGALRAIIR